MISIDLVELYKEKLENEENRNKEIIENLQKANIDPITLGKIVVSNQTYHQLCKVLISEFIYKNKFKKF